MRALRPILFFGGAALLGYAAYRGLSLYDTAEQLDYQITRSAFSKDNKFSDLITRPASATLKYEATIRIKNPTEQKLRFTYPYAKVMYNGTVVGSSQMLPDGQGLGVSELLPFKSLDLPFKIDIDSAPLMAMLPDFKAFIIGKATGKTTASQKLTLRILTEVNGIKIPPVDIDFII